MDILLEVITEALIKAAIVIIPILFAVLTAFIVKFLQAQMLKLEREGKDVELLLLQELTNIAVLATEQILRHDEASEEKLNFARKSLLQMASDVGISLTPDQALLLIEGTVHAIQNELPPTGYLIQGTEEDISNDTE